MKHFRQLLIEHEDQTANESVNGRDNSIEDEQEKPTKQEIEEIINNSRNAMLQKLML